MKLSKFIRVKIDFLKFISTNQSMKVYYVFFKQLIISK